MKRGRRADADAAVVEPVGELECAIAAAARGGRIPCATLFGMAAAREVSVAEVGRAVQRLGIRISGCQLGCF